MGFSAVEEDVEELGLGVDGADHEFEEVGVVGFVFFFLEEVVFGDEAFLGDFDQEVD